MCRYWDLIYLLYQEAAEAAGLGLLHELISSWPLIERTLAVQPSTFQTFSTPDMPSFGSVSQCLLVDLNTYLHVTEVPCCQTLNVVVSVDNKAEEMLRTWLAGSR
jgi:hypothetical protein